MADAVAHTSAAGAPDRPRTIASKLRPPHVADGVIERPELVQRLRAGRDRLLTLVCAPAGYGKTTVLAQWAAHDRERTPFVWISLDEQDSDPVRLWEHVITGLREKHARAGKASLEMLTAGPPAVAEHVVPALLDELSDAPRLVLVLDDWHLVRSRLCDTTMATFVERAPKGAQVVVSSRSDPAFPIARLRAHGDLVEIRERDLRASAQEAAAFLSEDGIELDPTDVERLAARTEGWFAGLWLARLVLGERDDPARFVRDFSGTSRLVFDYLMVDVLAAVTPELRAFLLRTSVLERLSAPLCDAVLERTDSAQMLREIERANLFLVGLDEDRREYRFHHLFAAVLRRELDETEPGAALELHARASAWHEAEGDIGAAVRHAIASRDVARSSDLVTRDAQAYWTSGRITTLSNWLEALSWPEAEADPQLALVRAHTAGLTGRSRGEIERWLRVAEAAPDRGPLANGLASLTAATGLLHAAYLSRGIAGALAGARRVLEEQEPSGPWHGPMLAMLGQALYLSGKPDEARAALERMRTVPDRAAWAPGAALGLAYLALVEAASGRQEEAERTARGALELLAERRLESGVVAANPHLALGCALLRTPDVRGAIQQFERAVELAAPAAPGYWHAHAQVRLAAALHRLGDDERARATLREARHELAELPDTGVLGELAAETDAALHNRARRDGFLGEALSEAELRVLRALARGLSVSEVAHELWLSTNTVKSHRRTIYRKLGVSTRDDMLARARDAGVLDDDGGARD